MTRLGSILVFAATLGCAPALPPAATCEVPAEITVTLASGQLLNPDEGGAPLPTEVRVHELRDPAAFESAAFEDAWAPGDALAASILSTHTTTLYPGETASIALTPSTEARALVGVVIVRRPAGRTWRAIVPVEALSCGSQATLAFRVDEYRIERATEAL